MVVRAAKLNVATLLNFERNKEDGFFVVLRIGF